MSALSTIYVTPEALKMYIMSKIMNADKEVLEKIADVLLGDRLYNCSITYDNTDNDNHLLKWE